MNFFKNLIIIYLVLILSLLIQRDFIHSSIISAALLAFLASFIFKNKDIINLIYTVLFCSMAPFLKNDFFMLHSLLICIISYISYQFLKNKFNGHGGKLGTIACFSTMTYYLFISYVN
ncbi:MAG: hypothetical protein N4A33_07630 [Bacteriovoracaceae bacterium]|nr:hypothetical protein [Bacteriovoracaceae bacterium]